MRVTRHKTPECIFPLQPPKWKARGDLFHEVQSSFHALQTHFQSKPVLAGWFPSDAIGEFHALEQRTAFQQALNFGGALRKAGNRNRSILIRVAGKEGGIWQTT